MHLRHAVDHASRLADRPSPLAAGRYRPTIVADQRTRQAARAGLTQRDHECQEHPVAIACEFVVPDTGQISLPVRAYRRYSRPDVSRIAVMIFDKFANHHPLYRQCLSLHDAGINVSRQGQPL